MASSSPLSLLLFLLTISISLSSSSSAIGGQRKVGGRTEVVNVESNREVQDLGRFCVEEYNRRLRSSGGPPLLSFSRVVSAEKQVVAGIKYYLRIAARDPIAARRRLFDAVVVVKPWAAEGRDLVSFAPSTNYWK